MKQDNEVIEYLKKLSNKVQDEFTMSMDEALARDTTDKEIDGIENKYASDLFAVAKTIFLINSLD